MPLLTNEKPNKKLKTNQEFFEIRKIWLEREIYDWTKRHSTSPPCGNLVDDLPRDCHTETQSIRRTGHPRTSMNFVVSFVFLIKFHIMSYWFAVINFKDIVLKFYFV